MISFFKKNREDYLSLYKVNPDTKAYVIEISLDDYSELFNGWDASPLKRKEIEPELMDYFVQAATEIPITKALEICFFIPAEIKDAEKESTSKAAIHNNFKIQLLFTERSLRYTYRRFLIYVLVSILLLTSAYVLPEIRDLSLMFKIMIEGMFIGGWWILWEGFSLVFFQGHEIRMRKKFLTRYLNSLIYFKENKY